MNKFQAMAQIMELLCKDGRMQPGSPEYKIARKLVSSKIDNLGPEAAWEQAKKSKGKILERERAEDMLEDLREKFPHINV